MLSLAGCTDALDCNVAGWVGPVFDGNCTLSDPLGCDVPVLAEPGIGSTEMHLLCVRWQCCNVERRQDC